MGRFASAGQDEEGRTIEAKKRRDSPGNDLAEMGHSSALSPPKGQVATKIKVRQTTLSAPPPGFSARI